MTGEENLFKTYVDRGGRTTHGGMRLRSVLEPQPGHDGFFKVVSTKVQCSPLRPHFPTRGKRQDAFDTQNGPTMVSYRFEDNCTPCRS